MDMLSMMQGLGGARGGGPARDGAFVCWAEDDDSVELKLPLPENTRKTDLRALFTPSSMSVTLRADAKPLLVVSSLAKRIVSDESTWYIEKNIMFIGLAKMQGTGASVSEQRWGRSLSSGAAGSTFTCWLAPHEAAARLGDEAPELAASSSSAGPADDSFLGFLMSLWGVQWWMLATAAVVVAGIVALAKS
ncbi:hypothetical protein T492DRAFT_981780 [Pavlovales sp. CCMP2436]|nr:hypothetical protein T492DRAFT_981780 [Pavlovales sp. CCMP2436]